MDEPLVTVEVMVNVEGLRRGWVGQVELTPRIGLLVSRGYLRVLGHVETAVVIPPPPVASETPEAAAPTELPTKRSRPSRAKGRATAATAEDDNGESPGKLRVE